MKRSYSSGFYDPQKLRFYKSLILEERYNKTNEQLLNYIRSKERTINISAKKSQLNIKLYNDSLINIFKKINDENLYIQDYIKLIIISQKRDTISVEKGETFSKYITLLNKQKFFKIKNNSNIYNDDDNNSM